MKPILISIALFSFSALAFGQWGPQNPVSISQENLANIGIKIEKKKVEYNNLVKIGEVVNIVIKGDQAETGTSKHAPSFHKFFPAFVSNTDLRILTKTSFPWEPNGKSNSDFLQNNTEKYIPVMVLQEDGGKRFGEPLIFWFTYHPDLIGLLPADIRKNLKRQYCCNQPVEPEQEVLAKLGITINEHGIFYKNNYPAQSVQDGIYILGFYSGKTYYSVLKNKTDVKESFDPKSGQTIPATITENTYSSLPLTNHDFYPEFICDVTDYCLFKHQADKNGLVPVLIKQSRMGLYLRDDLIFWFTPTDELYELL